MQETPVSNKEAQNEILAKQRAEILATDFREFDYTEEELEQLAKFKQDFAARVAAAHDSPMEFLEKIQSEGIQVVYKSAYFARLETLLHEGGKTATALFLTRSMIANTVASMEKNDETNHPFYRELQACLGIADMKGTIFLQKRPNQKSIWHEGAHAVQLLHNFLLDGSDTRTKLRRELEVNQTLLQVHAAGLLAQVPNEGYQVVSKSYFGEAVSLPANDINQEVQYFLANKAEYIQYLKSIQ